MKLHYQTKTDENADHLLLPRHRGSYRAGPLERVALTSGVFDPAAALSLSAFDYAGGITFTGERLIRNGSYSFSAKTFPEALDKTIPGKRGWITLPEDPRADLACSQDAVDTIDILLKHLFRAEHILIRSRTREAHIGYSWNVLSDVGDGGAADILSIVHRSYAGAVPLLQHGAPQDFAIHETRYRGGEVAGMSIDKVGLRDIARYLSSFSK